VKQMAIKTRSQQHLGEESRIIETANSISVTSSAGLYREIRNTTPGYKDSFTFLLLEEPT
jgi:hypothetical protein